ncbi:hypothetical protein [Crassaminicella profunda]|uniref:hypothetical protein n=1 Tax=Crassaminicella profunda TaxID=1286698 RepID=UPI001CA6F5AF|nr:hypothetical protein [Crassaminicella profunda]QZY56990.1 hypothetical protein K7H06_08755 [Crassaminicella profunda]
MKQIKNAKELLDPKKGSVKKALTQGKYKEITDLREKNDIVNATFGFGSEDER